MILGLGVDVVELDRIARSWERFGLRFAEKILVPEEVARIPERNPVPYLAARFAAKEAAAKALGTGISRGVTFHTIATGRAESGAPTLSLAGAALDRARELGAGRFHLTLTHGRDVAVAVVVLEKE